MKKTEKPIKTLLLKAKGPCVVMTRGGGSRLDIGQCLLLPTTENGEELFFVWPDQKEGRIPVPKAERILTEDGKTVFSTVRVIDWGCAVEIELVPLYAKLPEKRPPVLLDSTEFYLGDRRARAELTLNNGLQLRLITRDGEEKPIPLGDGVSGSLRVLDVGSARLLTVGIETDDGRQRLVILDPKGSVLLDSEADRALVEDGYPTAITRLGTVAGHEKRTRYEYSGGGFRIADERIGFFTHETKRPSFPGEAALAFVQELSLGLWEEAGSRLSPELSEELDEDSIRAYLGEFDLAALAPFEEGEGRATVGLFEKGELISFPRAFVFTLEDALITDITEL